MLNIERPRAHQSSITFFLTHTHTHTRIGHHMRGEVISVLSLERRYHILSRVSAANEGQNMIS